MVFFQYQEIKITGFYMNFIKIFITFVLILYTGYFIPVYSQVTYQQNHFLLKDKHGDEELSKLFVDTCETGVKKVIKHKNICPQESQNRVPRFAQYNPILSDIPKEKTDNTSARPSYNTKNTIDNLKEIISHKNKLGIKVSFGKTHTWSTLQPASFLPKIIVALATASSARFMYIGKEVNLIKWITAQKDKSVTIESLFQYSYILNDGNMYLTILTIENVLSDATFEEKRENTLVNQKLVDLYIQSPNKFGDWYHFFGTMLAGYTGAHADIIAKTYGVYRKISRGDEAELSTMHADKEGAKIGYELFLFVNETQLKESLKNTPKDKVPFSHMII